MDQFGVLVENYGIKQQGQSASMAALKSGIKEHSSKPGNSASWSGSKSVVDDNDDPFHFISGVGLQKPSNGGFDDLDFGFPGASGSGTYGNVGGSDFESVFQNSPNLGPTVSDFNGGDDLLSGSTGKNMSLADNDDLFSSAPVKVNSVDDLLGSLGVIGSGSSMDSESKKNKFDLEDELIPGFGPKPPSSSYGTTKVPKIDKPPTQEPQEASFFHIGSNEVIGGQYGEKEDGVNAWNFQAAAPADAEVDLDSFFTTSSTKSGASMSATTSEVDIDSYFSVQTPSTIRVDDIPIQVQRTEVDVDSLLGIPKPPAPNTTRVSEQPIPGQKNEVDILFDFYNVKISAEATIGCVRGTTSQPVNNSSSSSAAQEFDFFGGSMVSGAFEEIEGEDDERRIARLGRHKRTEERMAQALADMNSREFQAQQEQQERNRIAEIKDSEMKLWAAGKEGNLRALLSSLHLVLWPTCGWKALSLADLITSQQVKVAYKKACLCIHPDKVQQKGATTQEKYVAEKLFDLLKEASKKFHEEELR